MNCCRRLRRGGGVFYASLIFTPALASTDADPLDAFERHDDWDEKVWKDAGVEEATVDWTQVAPARALFGADRRRRECGWNWTVDGADGKLIRKWFIQCQVLLQLEATRSLRIPADQSINCSVAYQDSLSCSLSGLYCPTSVRIWMSR